MLKIDTERVQRELYTLAGFTDAEQSGRSEERSVTRIVFTQHDLDARAWLKTLYAEAGLAVREDPVGNTFARWIGSAPTEPAVGTGSHTDAIPHAGMFDGTVGVLGGLEAIRALQRSGFQPRRSIELVMFTAEEPTRLGIGCLGSRLMAGALDPQTTDNMRGWDDMALQTARSAAGFQGDLAAVQISADTYSAWVELHIEQGSFLERGGTDIGVVTHIAAPASYRFTVQGFGGHAGALLMPDRRDALCAAAELILAIEHAALASESVDTVATVGELKVHPGAVNSVPSQVRLTLDLRDTDLQRRGRVMQSIRHACDEVRVRRNVLIHEETINADAPASSAKDIVDAIENACEAQGATHQRIISRAYHDTLFMARIAPVAMIFVPSRDGISHRPDEFTTPACIETGIRVLAETLSTLAQ